MDNLSEEELQLIKNHRALKAEKEKNYLFGHKAITVAKEFKEWLEMSGQNASYRSFYSDFGYNSCNALRMYETVKRILDTVWPGGQHYDSNWRIVK